MVQKERFKLVKTLERSTSARYSDTQGLKEIAVVKSCFTLEPGDFETVGQADEMRSLKDHVEDYIIIQVW